MTAAARILIADDHSVIRRGLRALLEAEPGWQVCAEGDTGRKALALAVRHRPEVAVLDITMPELDGIEAARRIREASPSTKILLFTVHDSDQLLARALDAGVDGILFKSDADGELVTAVAALLDGRRYFSPRMARISEIGASPHLTPRELEVVHLIADGRSTKEVAVALGVSVKTADTHRTNAMRKLGVHSVSDLVRWAIRNGIVQA